VLEIHPKAQRDLRKAEETIEDFFEDIGYAEKANVWKQKFLDELNVAFDNIEKDPKHYRICDLYPLSEITGHEYHYFRALWFTGFCIIDAKRVVLLHIVSSKSDFSKIAPRGL